jgi:hypothetical protein
MKRLMILAAFGIATAVGIATAASSTEQGFSRFDLAFRLNPH